MQRAFNIGERMVGEGHRCAVVAEAGSNHNGRLEMALDLIDEAGAAKVDAVKFQTFKASRLYPRGAGTSDYLNDDRPIFDIIESMEMPEGWLPRLCQHAHDRGLGFLSTPFHVEAVELLRPFVDAFKVASYELTHVPLLKAVARAGKPVILSTGASTLDEVASAVHRLSSYGCEELMLMQCTAAYPAPLESMNVRAIQTMRERFNIPVGLSDHSLDPVLAPTAAVALGAAMIEKHVTLSKQLEGPDHAFAVEPGELARLVRRVRLVESVLGAGDKVVDGVEEELRSFARRSIITTRAIRGGEQITAENIDVLRHGKLRPGLAPEWLERVIGASAARDLRGGVPLREEDVILSGDDLE